ncbi:hypothetical protein [Enterovirga rhinocerotis]|uniref:Uncharacterized protein n=1 Tax=Enterovirga rhinocerotis TaxID=1339210 RepID=A0A4V6PZP8_9HYPH|nr:hypothetical protein [Enterovirga rhinocerotis]TDR95675.1 hypothetical protein EV668_0059 [Enterovirga rhinocerotis]
MTIEQKEEAPRNKGGRPRKHPKGERRSTLSFRVRGDMHERLAASGRENERSISEEIEFIIQMHYARRDHSGGADAEKLLGLIQSSFDIAARMGRPVSFKDPDSVQMAKGMLDTCFRHMSEGPKPFDVPLRGLSAEEAGDNMAQLALSLAGELPTERPSPTKKDQTPEGTS